MSRANLKSLTHLYCLSSCKEGKQHMSLVRVLELPVFHLSLMLIYRIPLLHPRRDTRLIPVRIPWKLLHHLRLTMINDEPAPTLSPKFRLALA